MNQYTRLTIDDIAKLAGVSRTTASMVLNGRAEEFRISARTKQRVLDIAEAHHFLPSHSARTLRSGCSNTLGLVVPELTNFAHASLAQAMEPLCHKAGYQLLVVSSDEDPQLEKSGIEHLVARQVDGLMIVPCSIDADAYAYWNERLPVVLVDRRVPESALPFVVTDAQQAVTTMMQDALRHNISEAYYFGGQPNLSPSIDRLAGFRAALKQAGLIEQTGWVRARDYRRSSGYNLMRECYEELGRYPQVLFTGSITLLEGALSFISERRHFSIAPQRIITFDDHNLLDCMPLAIDAIQQDSNALATASIASLLAILQREQPENVWIPAKLHWRTQSASSSVGQ